MTKQEFAGRIDYTLLRQDVTFSELKEFIQVGRYKSFHSLCIPPFFVKHAKKIVKKSSRISTVIGFPHGTSSISTKAYEATQAIRDGADCIDFVINIGALKSGNYEYLEEELSTIKFASQLYELEELRVIIETCFLTDEEKIAITKLIMKAGGDVVKTSTGFGMGNATLDDIRLLKRVTEDKIKIKAAGGIRDLRTAKEMIKAGADLLGTSFGLDLVNHYVR